MSCVGSKLCKYTRILNKRVELSFHPQIPFVCNAIYVLWLIDWLIDFFVFNATFNNISAYYGDQF